MTNIEIEMMNGDVIKAELYPDVAPITVENFVKLINENFFDGLIFHRVIRGFMIQGGGYDVSGNHKDAVVKLRTFALADDDIFNDFPEAAHTGAADLFHGMISHSPDS